MWTTLSALAAGHPDDRGSGLVSGLRRRDPRAFDAVHAQFHARLRGFLCRLTRRRDVAEDLAQEVWLQVARHADRLAPETDLAAWLFTIAKNRYRSFRRRSTVESNYLGALTREPPDAPTLPDAAASARAEVAAVEGALGAISAAHREVLLLALVDGLDAAQVGAVLGVREDAARKRLSRARAELAICLDQRGDRARRPAAKAEGPCPTSRS